MHAFTQENAVGIRWGTGSSSSSFSYTVDSTNKVFNIFAVLNSGDTGRISLNFGVMKGIIFDSELHAFTCVFQPENFERFINEVLRLQTLAKEGKENES